MKKTMKMFIISAVAMTLLAGVVFAGGSKDGGNVLEFYHGYHHSESEWPVAKAMRDIYDEFARQHANGPITFKPIPVISPKEQAEAAAGGGNALDIVDANGYDVRSAAAQGLLLDLKPYIDANGLKDAVGLNYTQNNLNGHIYTVHDQIGTRGVWYNTAILKKAGVSMSDLDTWDGFAAAMQKVRALNDGSYGYIAGQGSIFMFVAKLADSAAGRDMLMKELTRDTINSAQFRDAFLTIARLDQANGSAHTTVDIGNMMDDFNKNGKVAVLHNGVWNAGGLAESVVRDVEPGIFPGNVGIATASTGIIISSKMSKAKQDLALEFLKYMVSPEVQQKIFLYAEANPCNTTIDSNALAASTGKTSTQKLATACTLVNAANIKTVEASLYWGGDVQAAIINALMECAVSGTNIENRFQQLQRELIAIIG